MTKVTALVPIAERPWHERVARAVRREMADYGVTQTRMAAVLGLSQQAVSSKRNGKTPFTLDELEVVASMFGMKTEDLLIKARALTDPPAVAEGAGPEWAPWGSNPQPTD